MHATVLLPLQSLVLQAVVGVLGSAVVEVLGPPVVLALVPVVVVFGSEVLVDVVAASVVAGAALGPQAMAVAQVRIANNKREVVPGDNEW